MVEHWAVNPGTGDRYSSVAPDLERRFWPDSTMVVRSVEARDMKVQFLLWPPDIRRSSLAAKAPPCQGGRRGFESHLRRHSFGCDGEIGLPT